MNLEVGSVEVPDVFPLEWAVEEEGDCIFVLYAKDWKEVRRKKGYLSQESIRFENFSDRETIFASGVIYQGKQFEAVFDQPESVGAGGSMTLIRPYEGWINEFKRKRRWFGRK